METADRKDHWNAAYASKGASGVSWFEQRPQVSLDLIRLAGATPSSSLIDIGGGASLLVDALVDDGWRSLAVLDLSAEAIATAKERVGSRANFVDWIVDDATRWKPAHTFDVWHDRAAFHFLTDPGDREAYVDAMKAGLAPGGHAVIGTFAPDGPERCSGLPVMRYDSEAIAATVGNSFALVHQMRHVHTTPWGSTQSFQFALLGRVASD